jgi:hypothetical protein
MEISLGRVSRNLPLRSSGYMSCHLPIRSNNTSLSILPSVFSRPAISARETTARTGDQSK